MSTQLLNRDWVELSLCKKMDKNLFFPDSYSGVKKAKEICTKCPVSEQCLQYAITNDITYGVWGGLGETDRLRLRRVRKSAGL
jgi:WhiB family transcriptional regulator, redox-sensing transcriptional regulator